MKEWLTSAELASLALPGLPSTQWRITARATKEGWQRREREGRGGGWEYNIASLPDNARSKYILAHAEKPAAKAEPAGRSSLWKRYERSTQKQKDEAALRLQVLDAVDLLVRAGIAKLQAQQQAAEKFDVPPRTIRTWFSQVRNLDRSDRLAALVPSHGGGAQKAGCSEDAWDWLKAVYLRAERQSFTACYDELRRIAQERGWTVPGERTLLRRIESEIPLPQRVLMRDGPEALARMFPAQRRDRSIFHALEAVNADGHKFDVFVERPGQAKSARPLGIFWQDLLSGKILAYRIDWSENKDALRLSFGDLVEQYGIPTSAYLDNGRANASKWLTGGMEHRFRFKAKAEDPVGIFTQLGIDVHWTTPYHGQAKPIERAFRDFCDRISKHPSFAGHYTGNSPVNKPHNYDEKKRGVKLDTFLRVLEAEVIHHNARTGRRAAVCAGRSFDEVFAESYASAPIRKATEEQRRLWLLPAEQVLARYPSGSINFYGNDYWIERLAGMIGERVVVRFDPQRLQGGVHIYRTDGVYVGLAPCTMAAGFSDTEGAREYNRARNDFKRAQREGAAAEVRMSIAQASELITVPQPPEIPSTRLVQPIFKPVTEQDEIALKKASGQSAWEQNSPMHANLRALKEERLKNFVPDL